MDALLTLQKRGAGLGGLTRAVHALDVPSLEQYLADEQ